MGKKLILLAFVVCISFGLCGHVLAAESCEHEYVLYEEFPSCTKPGLRYYECAKCGDQTGYENVKALGHDFGEWGVAEKATCNKDGKEVRVCGRCDAVEEKAIPATGHTYQTKIVAPTCEKQGYTLHTCNVCGDSFKSDYTDATGHSYTTEVIASTCEKQGYTLHTCNVCGDSFKSDYTDAAGHSYTTEVIAPTCEKQGYTLQTCTVCGDTVKTNYTDALGHEYVEDVIAPTCDKQGYTLQTCTVCGDSVKSDYVDPTGHQFLEEVIAPTCTKDGYTLHTCLACGESTKTDHKEKLGHDYDEGVVTKEPSTTSRGKITYTCRRCGDSYSEYTDKIVNPFVDVKEKDYFFSAVMWAAERGITSGTDETHFSPHMNCSRAQVVTFLWRAAGKPASESEECPFTDVPEDAYYRMAVIWAVEQGITSGVGEEKFAPNAVCTRGQVVAFLYRSAGEPECSGDNRFVDVLPGDYYYKAVIWAAENQITSGVEEGRFGPHQVCSRGQIVSFLFRAENADPNKKGE